GEAGLDEVAPGEGAGEDGAAGPRAVTRAAACAACAPRPALSRARSAGWRAIVASYAAISVRSPASSASNGSGAAGEVGAGLDGPSDVQPATSSPTPTEPPISTLRRATATTVRKSPRRPAQPDGVVRRPAPSPFVSRGRSRYPREVGRMREEAPTMTSGAAQRE